MIRPKYKKMNQEFQQRLSTGVLIPAVIMCYQFHLHKHINSVCWWSRKSLCNDYTNRTWY